MGKEIPKGSVIKIYHNIGILKHLLQHKWQKEQSLSSSGEKIYRIIFLLKKRAFFHAVRILEVIAKGTMGSTSKTGFEKRLL